MKKGLQELNRLFFQDSGSNFTGVIQGWLLQEIEKSPCRAAFRVPAAEDDPPNAAMHDRPGAHGAGLFGDVKVTIGETPVSLGLLSLGEGEHLGMGGRVPEGLDLVVGARDDPAFLNDDGSDGHFLREISFLSLTQRLAHHEYIA